MWLIIATKLSEIDWTPVLVQSGATLALIFGGAGFWEWRIKKFQAKREDAKIEKDYDTKFDNLSEQISGVSDKVGLLSEDVQDLKKDIALLQEANRITAEYRKTRDEHDEAVAIERTAVIESLKAMIRDRLLDAYERCMEKGYYTVEERETYSKLYECYHGKPLEGNGVMGELQKKMLKLPTSLDEIKPKSKRKLEIK